MNSKRVKINNIKIEYRKIRLGISEIINHFN